MGFNSHSSILDSKALLKVACLVELGTGLVLLVLPQLLARLLLGAEVAGTGLVMSRLWGLSILALGVACWPGMQALRGILAYNVLITICLVALMVDGEFRGIMLLPGIILHGTLTLLLLRIYMSRNRAATKGSGS